MQNVLWTAFAVGILACLVYGLIVNLSLDECRLTRDHYKDMYESEYRKLVKCNETVDQMSSLFNTLART